MLVSISLQQFRSYNKYSLDLDPSLTYIIGPNTAGKTNILEAIQLLSSGKSFRGVMDREMIMWGNEYARITVKTDDDDLEILLTVGTIGSKKTPRKRYLVNGIGRRISDTVSNLPTVLFSPEDLDIVRGTPSLRRKYLDQVLIQVNPSYHRNLLLYEKALRQRNKLLSLIHDELATSEQLFYWNAKLIESGTVIHEARETYLLYQNSITLDSKLFTVEYDHSIINADRLKEYAEEEIAAKATLVGPHRDDFSMKLKKSKNDTVRLDSFGSRGEQRLGVLWLKMGALRFIETTLEQQPLLLLDDIFSELDEVHQQLVLTLLSTYQTIITSADPYMVKKMVNSYPGKIIEL